MNHKVEECTLNDNPLDYCDPCGELTACTCLASLVESWSISKLSFPLSFAPEASYVFDFSLKGDLVEYHGVAYSYRQAMDAIAHYATCGKESK
jgi:hypothetical protein